MAMRYLYDCHILCTTFSFSLSLLGHCALCKDVLSFVFQTFDFQVLCFVFLLLCFVSCVVGRTCAPTPLLAIYAIQYLYINISLFFLVALNRTYQRKYKT